MEAETYYLVVVNKDGGITTYTEIPEELPKVERVATNLDVFQNARQIVDEFEREILTGRIVQAMVAIMSQKEPTPQEKVKDALKKRNINPESVTPVD
jgi:hypothetical protein